MAAGRAAQSKRGFPSRLPVWPETADAQGRGRTGQEAVATQGRGPGPHQIGPNNVVHVVVHPVSQQIIRPSNPYLGRPEIRRSLPKITDVCPDFSRPPKRKSRPFKRFALNLASSAPLSEKNR